MLPALALLVSAAWAQDLVYQWPQDQERLYQVEVYWYDIIFSSTSELNIVYDMFTWTFRLACRTGSGEDPELSCSVHDDTVYRGYRPEGSSEVVLVEMPFPGQLQAEFTERGRIKSLDVQGDRTPFWDAYAEFQQAMLSTPVVFSDSERERMGRDLEHSLLLRALGTLELELPKNGDDKGKKWKQSGMPQVMRFFSQSSGIGRVKSVVEGREGSQVRIRTSGEATEQPTDTASSAVQIYLTSQLEASAVFDAEQGQLLERQGDVSSEPGNSVIFTGPQRCSFLVKKVDAFE